MRGCEIVVVSPSGKKTEYESKRDFWRHSSYSLASIDEAVKTSKPLKDGTRVRLKHEEKKVIAFKGIKQEKFRTYTEAGKRFCCKAGRIKELVESGEDLDGWTFDIL